MLTEIENSIRGELDKTSSGEMTFFFLEGLLKLVTNYPDKGGTNLIEEIILNGRFLDNNRRFPVDQDLVDRSIQQHGVLKYAPGQIVRAWRNNRGLYPAELVRRAGPPISKAYLSKLEASGKRNVHHLYAVTLANGLEINASYLVSGILPDNPSFEPPTRRRIKT